MGCFKMKYIFSVFATVFLFACSSTNVFNYDYSSDQYDISHVKANLEFLASDQLEGRETASDAEKVASRFIVTELEKYGLKPFGDSGTFFQNINFVSRILRQDSKIVIFNEDNSVFNLNIGEDFLTQANRNFDSTTTGRTAKLVFASYGIAAREYEYDDYQDVDVNGKIVIVLSGEPFSENEDFFNGTRPSAYSHTLSKIITAQNKGAIGILMIPSEEMRSYWGMMKNFSMNESISVSDISDGNIKIPSGLISIEGLNKIFADEKKSFEQIEKLIKENEIPAAFELKKQASIILRAKENQKPGRNVVAILPGKNPSLQEQYVTIGAHYDHVGVIDGQIYNGADDNGSGTVSVLECARILSDVKANQRPIVFLFYTGEEKGLLGSEFFVDNSKIIDSVLVNINIDMTGRNGLDSIHCIGSDRVSKIFHDIIAKVNDETVQYILDYSLSDTRLFMQSDQYSFSKKNIPVVFFFDNMNNDLHKPSDDVEKINFDKICKTAHLSANIALEIANMSNKIK